MRLKMLEKNKLNIKSLQLGDLGVNCYVIDYNGETMVIDPGADPITVISQVQISRGRLKYIFLTHGHYDHIGALDWVYKKFDDVKFYMGGPDVPMLKDPTKNFSSYMGEPFTIKTKPELLSDDMEFDLGGLKFHTRACPGHSQGSVSIFFKDNVFTGDLLFKESVGRTDFPGGSMDELLKSIKDNILVLPDTTKVFPGHGSSTTVGHERLNNPFI